MLQRPVYQTSIAFLTLLALAGGIALLIADRGSTGVLITSPEDRPEAATPTPISTSGTATERELVDINSATAGQLAALPEIGPVLSERIVAFRDANGKFLRGDQLMAVEGIGPATYAAVSDLITVGD